MADDGRLRDEQRPIEEESPSYEEKFRRYLLGLCGPEESGEVERGIFEEEHPMLDVIEDELVEDYVTGELSESDRSHFEERFLFSQERVEKTRLSAMLLGRLDFAESLGRKAENLRQKLAVDAVLKDALQVLPVGGPQFRSLDKSYVERLRAGDVQTAEHFVAYFTKLIQIKLRSRLKSPQAIEDLRQESFARFFAALRTGMILQPKRLDSFVNSICNNVLLEHYRASGRSSSPQGQTSQSILGTSSETFSALQAREEKTREILEQLPKRDRHLLREIFVEERDKDQVCRDFGVDREYLRVLLHRTKMAFKSLLFRSADSARDRRKQH